MTYTQTEKGYIIKIPRGDRVIETLTDFCKEKNISAGLVHGIGAVQEATFGYYDFDKREYVFKTMEEMVEVVSMTGNVALVEGEQFLHVHAVFADQAMKAYGGHVKEMTVGVVLEVFLTDFETKIERAYDEETGLKLFNI